MRRPGPTVGVVSQKPKEESFKRKKVGKVANLENVLIVFAFNFICLWLIQGAGLHFIQNAMEVVFREACILYLYVFKYMFKKRLEGDPLIFTVIISR